MSIINKEILLSHGNKKGRKIAIDIAEHALKSVNSYEGVRKIVNISNGVLSVGILKYDLSEIKDIFVFGAGKATMGQAKALDEILGNRIKKGIVIVKKGQGKSLKNIEVIEGGHPVPDNESFLGARKILDAAKKVGEGGLVFLIDSGGSSALMSHPAEDSQIAFEDERKVTSLLLMCGAPIYEMNSVRRHITAMKGGRLQQRLLSRGAEVINLVIPDTPRIVQPSSDVKVPRQGGWEDETTFGDAVRVLKSYDLWSRTPEPIKNHLKKGLSGEVAETPKDFEGMKVNTFSLGSVSEACEAASLRAEQLGFKPVILTTVLEGESREAGIILASLGKGVQGGGGPVEPPCVLILGGETTVTIEGECGEGGPSQELALGFATKVTGNEKLTCLALDTDGTDGPTEFAGGIVDGYTLKRAEDAGLYIHDELKKHNSTHVLRELNNVLFTGPTDTNVCDINIVVVT